MILARVKKSLRLKLLIPVSLLLIGSFTGLGVAIVQVQRGLLIDMGTGLNTTLADADAELKAEFTQLEVDLKGTMTALTANTAAALADKTRAAFAAEAKHAQREGDKALADKADTVTELLAKVAPQAILHNRIGDLIKFAKSAESNSDVIFALFMREDGRPYTPLMNAREPHIKSYIDAGTGQNKHEKLISAAKKDLGVLMRFKQIEHQGEVLGEVVIAVSRESLNVRNAALATRLNGIVEANRADIQTVLAAETAKVAKRLNRSVDTIAAKNRAVIDKTGQDISTVSQSVGTRTKQVILAMGMMSAVLMIGGVGLLIVYLLIKPLETVVAGLKAIAQGEGDLTTRLVVKNADEMGSLAHWFNTFMAKLQSIIADVAVKAETVSQSSGKLTDLSAQMSSGSDHVSQKTNSVSHAAQEMSTSLNSVAAASEQATTNMGMVAATVEEMSATIAEIAQNAEQARSVVTSAVQQAGKASSQVNQLGDAATQISAVTEVITEISEQTNLLALNATIEAARAGEAGKGFAVVAHEIKELASQTAQATQDIKTKIGEIQGSTELTVTDIASTSEVIDGVNEIVATIATAVEEQSMSTREIAGNLSQASGGVEEINTNIAKSNQVAAEMADEVTAVNQVTDEISQSSGRVNTNARELADLAAELKGLIGGFRV